MNPNADEFYMQAKNWKSEMEQLRMIVLECNLVEDFKWKQPCYTYKGKNILIVSAFKDFAALNFFKGALLADPYNMLAKPGEFTQQGRFMKFNDVDKILNNATKIKEYILEAIDVEESGVKIDMKKTEDYPFPLELEELFNNDISFRSAFNSLTPGRQRAYLMYFSQAKQSQTRIDRIEKYKPRILLGKGITDCTCGHSQRMPNCDGTHKRIN